MDMQNVLKNLMNGTFEAAFNEVVLIIVILFVIIMLLNYICDNREIRL